MSKNVTGITDGQIEIDEVSKSVDNTNLNNNTVDDHNDKNTIGDVDCNNNKINVIVECIEKGEKKFKKAANKHKHDVIDKWARKKKIEASKLKRQRKRNRINSRGILELLKVPIKKTLCRGRKKDREVLKNEIYSLMEGTSSGSYETVDETN